MAIKKYRVAYGSHSIPNPEYKQDPVTGIIKTPEVPSHVIAVQGQVIEMEENRAASFTRTGFGLTPKLVEVSDSAGIPEINTAPPPSPGPSAEAAATSARKASSPPGQAPAAPVQTQSSV